MPGKEPLRLDTDVLVVGSGGAGMYAAYAAARDGARVVLAEKNVVGRGGGTIMAQMTCASALGEAEPDDPEQHVEDTIAAGRDLCNESLAALLCEGSPVRIRELGSWKVKWAREEDGRIKQVQAPGHGRKRCVYVDYLRTGAAICAALRGRVSRAEAIRRVSHLGVVDLLVSGGRIAGAVGLDTARGEPVVIAARAVIVATGGLTKLFARTTASDNIAGEGAALALRAGARLVDTEFVQFLPVGHLAPRLVGMDPTTWEPMRVKLGGRILNGRGEEFLEGYGEEDAGTYKGTRDRLTYAIYKEVEAGRGSPHGGAYLSFEHVDEAMLKAAVGPMVDVFLRNGIDITRQPVEIAPIAHYHMGGIEVDTDMATRVPGLYAAGEAAGGANGANRLSGNAVPEALVFGERAGTAAARHARDAGPAVPDPAAVASAAELVRSRLGAGGGGGWPTGLAAELKRVMWEDVGPFRNADALDRAVSAIRSLREDALETLDVPAEPVQNAALREWFELRNGLLTAEAVALAARERRESRGAHQREDFPETDPGLARPQRIALADGVPVSDLAPGSER